MKEKYHTSTIQCDENTKGGYGLKGVDACKRRHGIVSRRKRVRRNRGKKRLGKRRSEGREGPKFDPGPPRWNRGVAVRRSVLVHELQCGRNPPAHTGSSGFHQSSYGT